MNIKTTEDTFLDENLTTLVEKYKRTVEIKNKFEEDNKNLRQKLDEVGHKLYDLKSAFDDYRLNRRIKIFTS
jgi:hypothetical protein